MKLQTPSNTSKTPVLFFDASLGRLATSAFFPLIMLAQQPKPHVIAYTHAPEGAAPWPVEDISLMNADGSNVRAFTTDGHSHSPVWSPDGRRILFIHDSNLRVTTPWREQKEFESHHPVELFLMDADGGNRQLLRRLEPVVYGMAWSPDGKTIAITCIAGARPGTPQPAGETPRVGLFLLPADGQGELKLVARNAYTPSWSPDGKKLAFSVEQSRGRWSVHVANADGSDDVQLTPPGRTAGSPVWSPDGKRIAFDGFAAPNLQQIFLMETDGSHEKQITNDSNWSCTHPSWSPDGDRIAFSCRSASSPCGMPSSVGSLLPECTRRIFTVSLTDSAVKPTPLGPHDGWAPAFAPAP